MSKLTPTQKVFKAIVANPGQSRLSYAKAAKLETAVVGRAFQTLKKDGLITMKGDRRGATYTTSRTKAAQKAAEDLGLALTVTRRTTEAKPKKAEPKKAAPKTTKVEAPKAKRVRPSRSKAAIEARAKAKVEAAPAAEAPVETASNQ
jgi:DNA-binding transcriptional regulator YhcF (GntR family)